MLLPCFLGEAVKIHLSNRALFCYIVGNQQGEKFTLNG